MLAIPPGESPIVLVQGAAKDHIPVLPSILRTCQKGSLDILVPDLKNRPPIRQILREITGQQSTNYDEEDINEYTGLDWYKGQIVYRETVAGSYGMMGILRIVLNTSITLLSDFREFRKASFYSHCHRLAVREKYHRVLQPSSRCYQCH